MCGLNNYTGIELEHDFIHKLAHGHLPPGPYIQNNNLTRMVWNTHVCHYYLVKWWPNECIVSVKVKTICLTLQWRHNKRDGVSNHRCSGADQSKYQTSASLTFMRGIHRWPVNSPHKVPVTRKLFPFDDVIMVWRRPAGRQAITLTHVSQDVWRCITSLYLDDVYVAVVMAPQVVITLPWIHVNVDLRILQSRLTHGVRDKMATILLTTYSNAFSWSKMY